jgi:3-dehydroquinate dehydratase/shikimate dehydrogenase
MRDLKNTIARASKAADVIEVRLDCISVPEFKQCVEETRAVLRRGDCPAIITFRPAAQGGRREFDYASRYLFWNTQYDLSDRDWFDVELDLAEGFASSTNLPSFPVKWEQMICSHHDFTGIPADLEQIYDRMAATPARILKIAVQADDVTDCLPIFRLLERARSEGRELIAIAMGPAGIATRILGPSRGAFLTYGALETQQATAPGQMTADELRAVYRIDTINPQTQIMGLVGSPVLHSVSPHMQNAAFAEAGINAVYIPFEVRDVTAFLRRMVQPRTREIDWNLRGLSVTAPHKAAVIDCLDWVEPAAEEIGAVNTIVVHDDALHGYNTDAIAILEPVIKILGPLRDACCAVIGAGGAASAALWSLRKEGAKVTVFARNVEKRSGLAGRFGAECKDLAAARFDGFDLVINTTPLGTSGRLETETPAMCDQLRGARLAYDLVYNPTETRFMREAREAGCQAIGGLAMLVGQATEQFKLWTGTDAPVEIMWQAAKSSLDQKF